MKKFLTVLLVIAVMFTFSFGSAFAASASTDTTETTRNEAIASAQKALLEDLEEAAVAAKAALADEYVEGIIDADCIIDKAVYAATIDEIVGNYTTVINTAARIVKTNEKGEYATAVNANYAAEIAKVAVEVIEYNGNAVAVSYPAAGVSATELVAKATAGDASNDEARYYIVYTWTNALADMKAYVNGEIEKIDMSLYTNDIADKNDPYEKTWAELAQEAKDAMLKTVADTDVNVTMNRADANVALTAMYAVLDKLGAEETYKDIYENEYITSYNIIGLKTAEDLEDEAVVSGADKAALLAAIKSNVAAGYKAALTQYNKDENKDAFEGRQEILAAYEEVYTVLVEAGKITSVPADALGNGNALKALVAEYEKATDHAAVLKLQVEKDGSAKYDADKIDEILEDLKVEIYAGGDWSDSDFDAALVATSNLAWEKEVAIAKIKANLAKALEAEYYAPEAEKVEAKYQELIDKVEAAETSAQLEKCATQVSVATIKTEAQVNTAVAALSNTAKFETAVKSYIDYLNIGVKAYEDGYREYPTKAEIAEYLAEQGARTNADVAALYDQAEVFAQGVATNGEKEAAEAAAIEMIKALPTTITLADKEAVKAAWEAAQEVGYTSTKLTKAVAAVKAAEDKAIDDAIKALPAKLTADDADAVAAILEAIEVYEGEDMYAGAKYDQATKANKAFEAVRAAALADVHAAIAAVDADDEASVVAAREAVDAFVEEYTDAYEPYQAIAQIKNIDKLTYAEAQVALAKIEAVEALKITAKSSAKKGSITVKWTVKGDTSAVEGYEIWKSTKHSSGYKKAFTTEKMSYKNTKGLKKGTRYYYKVRAIAHVNGEKITSDWSNKARRIAK